ncbi:bifunctional folylpolyglutamate synthase/dihydrofolate synthase [Candidatus Formimonas warabiya]|uniref:tetrahydrofolate synthase n=2 Tax=Formimonas warabiya TaxID=1761012 RepID=A0A3G1L1P9_FORW1|nr:folylpolyglutamate synthase/dihydrofolate synthase family protein [Candidatus Formimonas warabiya]ATW28574.1 bifunctional folylpolyglutamate synthase/dihydrofolate synthase [Candidatus Formimonas warabiya]
MNYDESMEYLKGLTKFGINLGLGRIRSLLSRLGHPEEKVEFVHVGGTNGKGSTCAMLASMLQQSGMRVGLFTSPHLHSYTERIRINEKEIKKEEIAELLTMMRSHLDAMVQDGVEHPTEFEVSTALALYYFAREKVDLAVMEVGMGGEIDSTNVILPRLAMITNVGMDHMDYLGSTLEDIARVKSGIIKENRDVITAVDHPRALAIIRERAKEKNAPLWEHGIDFSVEPLSYSHQGQIFNCTVKNTVFPNLKVPLRGRHQLVNAALAVAGAVKLGIGAAAIRKGLALTDWPCRLETVRENPLIVIDAAHNHHGIKVLVDALQQYWPDRKKILLLGMLADKEREKVAAEIAPLVEKAVVTKPNSPRAGAWQQVAEFVRPYVKEIAVEENISHAVDLALTWAGSEDMILITGSIYMVAEARAHLMNGKR